VYRRDQGRTIWLTCNWNAPMEECASTTNPQVGIKYERSIYLTSGRCLSGNFLQHSNTDKLSVSLKSCVCVCVCVYTYMLRGSSWPFDYWILALRNSEVSCAKITLQLILTSQKGVIIYVWRLQLFFYHFYEGPCSEACIGLMSRRIWHRSIGGHKLIAIFSAQRQ